MYGDDNEEGGAAAPAEGGENPAPKRPKKAPAKKGKSPKKPKAKKAPAKKGKKGDAKPRKAHEGVGLYIRELLVQDKFTHAQIVEKALAKFPDSGTDTKDVTWQKWAMKTGRVPKPAK